MHELSLVENILEIAETSARQDGADEIRTIALRIGAFSSVDAQALTFAFEAAKQGTMAQNAQLELEIVAVVAYCERCKLEFEVDNPFGIALCPKCNQPSAAIQRGEELELRFLEVV
jgi:hydrogenase nickel incorporation protein HypA/HybF